MSDGINRIKGHNELQEHAILNDETDAAQAPLASPAFTGVPTAPTAAPATNTTQIATTAFVLANSGSGGATTELNNLTTTAINANLLPDVDSVRRLGSSSDLWDRVYTNQVRGGNGLVLRSSFNNISFFPSSGIIDASNSAIVQLATPVNPGDAANKAYVDANVGSTIMAFTSALTVGGAVTETVAVTGLLATDTLLAVSQIQSGAGAQALVGFNTLVNDAITLVWIGDPGPGAKVLVTIKR